MSPVVIWGNGQVAELALARLRRDTPHPVAAFTVDRAFLKGDRLHDLPVVAFEEVLDRFPPDRFAMVIAVGHSRVNHLRAERYVAAKAMGYGFINLVSPQATIWPGVAIGENCTIGDACVIQPYTRLGDNVRVGTGCVIGHHVSLGDHCSLAIGVTIAGSVTIEPYAFVGAGVVIRDRVVVGESAYLGAGVVLSGNARAKGVYAAPEPTLLPISSDRLPAPR